MGEWLMIVSVKTDTYEHARQVFNERLSPDEQYTDEEGVEFAYEIGQGKIVEAIDRG